MKTLAWKKERKRREKRKMGKKKKILVTVSVFLSWLFFWAGSVELSEEPETLKHLCSAFWRARRSFIAKTHICMYIYIGYSHLILSSELSYALTLSPNIMVCIIYIPTYQIINCELLYLSSSRCIISSFSLLFFFFWYSIIS